MLTVAQVQRRLDDFIAEIRAGQRRSAALACSARGELALADAADWGAVRAELAHSGIPPDAIAYYRDHIIRWLADASSDAPTVHSSPAGSSRATDAGDAPTVVDAAPDFAALDVYSSPAGSSRATVAGDAPTVVDAVPTVVDAAPDFAALDVYSAPARADAWPHDDRRHYPPPRSCRRLRIRVLCIRLLHRLPLHRLRVLRLSQPNQ